jgi:hypothetical protein
MKKVLIALFLFISLLDAKIIITSMVGNQVTKPSKEFKDDETMFGLGIRTYMDDSFAVDVRIESSDSNQMADGGRTDLERGSVNLFYDFILEDKVSPYLLVGVGYEKLHRTYLNIKSQPFYQAGGGIRFNLTKNLGFITEVKYLKKNNTKDNEVIATCGLGVKLKSDECKINSDLLYEEYKEKNCIAKPAIKPMVANKKGDKSIVFDNGVMISKCFLKDKKSIRLNAVSVSLKENYIQVAALSQKSNIIKTVKKLKSNGFKIKTIKKDTVTVVLVGPYAKNSIFKIYKKIKTIQKDAFYKKL